MQSRCSAHDQQPTPLPGMVKVMAYARVWPLLLAYWLLHLLPALCLLALWTVVAHASCSCCFTSSPS